MSRPKTPGQEPDRNVGSESAMSRPHAGKRSFSGKSASGIAVLALVGLYAFAQPLINERMGWDLPELQQGADGELSVVDSKSTGSKSAETRARAQAEAQASPQGPLADRMRPSLNDNSAKAASSKAAESRMSPTKPVVTAQSSKQGELLHGLLKEIGSKRYVSPAGLWYTPGSAEGHRLEHLRRHTEDQPTRPGSHGVFDGGMEGALKTIDLAYERAKKGERTTKQVDDGRTIYTVDMGGRVGFVGGSEGGRRRHPMARRVRLILEETRVITAYPM